jgi:transposase
VPTLRRGDIVIMDNLGSHRGKAVRELIRSTGAKLTQLLTHHPGFALDASRCLFC